MPRLLAAARGLARQIRSFGANRRGNVAIIVAFSLIPLVGLVGLGTDYGVALTDKSKLDNAADTAALAAVATAKAYVAANPSDTSLSADAIAAGLNEASRSFMVNMGNLPFAPVPTPHTSTATAPTTNTCGQISACIYLTQSGQTFTGTVYYRTYTQNHFGQLFGSATMNLLGISAATTDIPSYLDFYLLVDVSGSMGVPTSSNDQTNLANMNTKAPDPFPNTTQGCQFACHFPTYHGWTLATKNGIQLRSGSVNTAVCNLLSYAQSHQYVTNQYRVGVYPFIANMATLQALTSDYTNLNNAGTCGSNPPMAFTNLLDTGYTQFPTGTDPSTGTGSGGTHFESIFPTMQALVTKNEGNSAPYGNGASATRPRPFVFLITDGMDNPQHFATNTKSTYYYPGGYFSGPPPVYPYYPGYGNAGFDGSTPQAIDPTLCASLKAAGATVSILYIPYVAINSTPDPYGEIAKAQAAEPSVPLSLASCASTGFFYTANSNNDINNAVISMFQKAVQVSHLIQ